LAFETGCGIDFEDICSALSVVVDYVNTSEIETCLPHTLMCCFDDSVRWSNSLSREDKPSSEITNFPVDFGVRCGESSSFFLNCDSDRLSLTHTDVDTIFLLLLHVLYIQRSPYEISPSVSNDNPVATVASKYSPAYNRKRLVRDRGWISPEFRDDFSEAAVGHGAEEVEFVGGMSEVYRVHGGPLELAGVSITVVDDYVVSTASETACTVDLEDVAAKSYSETASSSAALLIRDDLIPWHLISL
jgi:hypothetical protein